MTIVIFLHAKWTTQEQSKDLENPDLEGLKNVLSTSKIEHVIFLDMDFSCQTIGKLVHNLLQSTMPSNCLLIVCKANFFI